MMCRRLVYSLRAAHSVSEGRNVGTLDCSPKSANITKKSTVEYWGAFPGTTVFSSTWSQLHVFFLRREIVHSLLCKGDTYILFFFF